MSMATPLRMSSVSLEDLPPAEAEDDSKKKCSRCGDWLPLDMFQPTYSANGGRRSSCRHCRRLYDILRDYIAIKDDDGNLVIRLPDGSTRTALEVATGIVRRGYRLTSLGRRPPKSLASLNDADADALAETLGKIGYPVRKIGEEDAATT